MLGFDVRDRMDEEIVRRIFQAFLDPKQDLFQRQRQMIEHVIACFGKVVMVMPGSYEKLKRKAGSEWSQGNELVF